MAFTKLVRFEHKGSTSYGDLVAEKEGSYFVKPFTGTPFTNLKPSGNDIVRVEKVRRPISLEPTT
jgi:hypothetical protein